MTTILLVIHIIIALAMVGIILLQKNEGGGLGTSSSTMGGLMTTRGTANLLTRVTGILAALFFVSTLGLAILFKGGNKAKSILDTPLAGAAPIAATSPIHSKEKKDALKKASNDKKNLAKKEAFPTPEVPKGK